MDNFSGQLGPTTLRGEPRLRAIGEQRTNWEALRSLDPDAICVVTKDAAIAASVWRS
jgi:hypothetical protein